MTHWELQRRCELLDGVLLQIEKVPVCRIRDLLHTVRFGTDRDIVAAIALCEAEREVVYNQHRRVHEVAKLWRRLLWTVLTAEPAEVFIERAPGE